MQGESECVSTRPKGTRWFCTRVHPEKWSGRWKPSKYLGARGKRTAFNWSQWASVTAAKKRITGKSTKHQGVANADQKDLKAGGGGPESTTPKSQTRFMRFDWGSSLKPFRKMKKVREKTCEERLKAKG